MNNNRGTEGMSLIEEIDNACYDGDYKTLIALCRASDENTKYMYLEEVCAPHISRGHIICANYIISCEKTDFVMEKYRQRYIQIRDWALRDHIIFFRFGRKFLRLLYILRKRKVFVHTFIKKGFF